MKKILALLFVLVALAGAATSALYLHHERSTQATVEADCQNRELCLDRTNLAPLGRFNDGTLWHGVTQEKPNVSLTGTLNVTGAATLANNLTLSLIPTGRVPYTTTSGLVTNSANLAYDGTTLAVNNGTYSGTLVVSSLTAFLPVFTNGSKVLASNAITGTGSVAMSVSPTFSGTVSISSGTAQLMNVSPTTSTNQAYIRLDNDASHRALVGKDNSTGNGLWASGGSTYALAFGTVDNFGLSFATNNIERFSIAAGGAATFTSTVTADSLISAKFYTEGTYTATLTGCTTSPTGTVRYVRIGKQVTLMIPNIMGTSNANTATLTGMPAGLFPARKVAFPAMIADNTAYALSGNIGLQIETTGVITLYWLGIASGFTSSGSKGMYANVDNAATSGVESFTYTLQ